MPRAHAKVARTAASVQSRLFTGIAPFRLSFGSGRTIFANDSLRVAIPFVVHGPMALDEVVSELNRLQADGLVANYAIGGAVAAQAYIAQFGLTERWNAFQTNFLTDL